MDVSIQLESPNEAGTYKGNYKLRNSDGVLFGIGENADGVFWVEIRVVLPSATPTTEVRLPDLVVSFIELDPPTPIRGDPVEVTVQVYNQGNAQAGSFIAQWWPGENYQSPACTWNISSMNAGGGRVLSCTYAGYPSPYGSINTLAIADVNDSVEESDETNNDLRMNISVVNP
jgi:subtilase family serine protease